MKLSNMRIELLLSLMIFCVLSCYAQEPTPQPIPVPISHPNGTIWCEYVNMTSTVPGSVEQPTWWMEYFMFVAPYTGNIGFKVYPGVITDAHTNLIVAPEYCPVFLDCGYYVCDYVQGPASLVLAAEENEVYIVFAHISGGNYTIITCDGTCGEVCPGDCNIVLQQGMCDLSSKTCVCATGWEGDDCGTKAPPPGNHTAPITPHKKVPFGSTVVFYSVVTGLPAVLLITAITATLLYLNYRDKIAKKKRPSSLIIPSPVASTGEGDYGSVNYGTARANGTTHHTSDHDVFEEHEGSPFYGPGHRNGFRRIGSS